MDQETLEKITKYRDVAPRNFSYYKVVEGVVEKLMSEPSRGPAPKQVSSTGGAKGRPVGKKDTIVRKNASKKPELAAARKQLRDEQRAFKEALKAEAKAKKALYNQLTPKEKEELKIKAIQDKFSEEMVEATRALFTGTIYRGAKRRNFTDAFRIFLATSEEDAYLIALAFDIKVNHIFTLRDLNHTGRLIIDQAKSTLLVVTPKDRQS